MSESSAPEGVESGDAQKLVSRRGVLQLSAAGAGAAVLGPKLKGAIATSTKGARVTSHASSSPKKGGTLTFGRNTGPTQLDPANSIVRGRRLHARQDL